MFVILGLVFKSVPDGGACASRSVGVKWPIPCIFIVFFFGPFYLRVLQGGGPGRFCGSCGAELGAAGGGLFEVQA